MNFLIGAPNTEYTRRRVCVCVCVCVCVWGGGGGDVFISSVSTLSFIFLSPLSLSFISFTISYLSSPFPWETTQNDPQGLTYR